MKNFWKSRPRLSQKRTEQVNKEITKYEVTMVIYGILVGVLLGISSIFGRDEKDETE